MCSYGLRAFVGCPRCRCLEQVHLFELGSAFPPALQQVYHLNQVLSLPNIDGQDFDAHIGSPAFGGELVDQAHFVQSILWAICACSSIRHVL